MSPCPSTLQLSPSVCVRLLCMLLLPLTVCSSSVSRRDPVMTKPLTRPNTTQANCTTECDDGGVGGKPPGNHPTNQQPASQDHQGPLPAMSALPLPSTTTGSTQGAPTGPITSTGTITSTTSEHVKDVDATTSLVTSKATTPPSIPTAPTSIPTAPTSIPTAPTSIPTAPTSIPTAPTSIPTAPTSIPTAPTSIPTTQTSTTTTATTSTTTTTRTSTAEPTAEAAHPATTTLTRAKATVTVATSTGTKMSPPPPSTAPPQPNAPSTGMPPVQTSLPRGPTTTTTTSTRATAAHDKPAGVVDVAGAALTSQLVDTASLLAALLFGLLCFLVTVAVFVTQAYESYRRKDYTQVDYLINGMYSDSGV